MTESENLSHQYNRIINDLQSVNLELNTEDIKGDLDNFLFNLFINDIESLELSKDISVSKIRKDIIRQKLQSSRQSKRLKERKDDRIKKERRYFKFKKIQSSLKRRTFSDSFKYPGTFSKRELFYISHTDDAFIIPKSIEKLNDYENQLTYPDLTKENKSSIFIKQKINDFDEFFPQSDINFPEIQEISEIFRKFEENEENLKDEYITKISIDLELRKRIRNLKLNPIEKKESKNMNLLDFIGYVNNNDDKSEK